MATVTVAHESPSETIPETFGARLRRWRTALGLSQAALARRVSYSRQSICDIEQGRRGDPAADVRRRLLDALLAAQSERAAEATDAAQLDATVSAWRGAGSLTQQVVNGERRIRTAVTQHHR